MNIKNIIRNSVSGGIYACRKRMLPAILDRQQCRILMYHSIERTDPVIDTMGLGVAPDIFRLHMKYLKDNNMTVIGLGDFAAMLVAHSTIPARSVVITFDDGYKSILSNALPVLKKSRYPATLFVNINFIERKLADRSYWRDWKTLHWDEILRLKDEGLSIGSHGVTHNRLNELAPKEVREEMRKSKEMIEKNIGSNVGAFSYPQGGFNEKVIELLKESGFTSACSSIEGVNDNNSDVFTLKRTEITAFDDTAIKFEKKILGSYDWIGLVKSCG